MTSLKTSRSSLKSEIAEVWQKPKEVQISQRCEEIIHLPKRVTHQDGPLSFDRLPFWRDPLDSLGDPLVEEVVIVSGAQLGKTTLCIAACCENLLGNQYPSLYVMPTSDMAKSLSQTRLQTIIESSEQLKKLKPWKKHQYKAMEMQMRTSTISLVGANSPSNISSRPVGLLILDEVDKYPTHTKNEAAAINLALERTKSYPLRKHIITSTPTIHEGTIWQFFLLGDQRKYYLPSPYAKNKYMVLPPLPEHEIIWNKSGTKIDINRSAKTARVVCPHTGELIRDSDKPDMLAAGRWQAENEEHCMPKRRSYQISSIYSPDITFEEVVAKYLAEKSMPNGTQNFWNSWAGMPYNVSDDIEEKPIPTGEYSKRHNWPEEKTLARVMIVDVQRDHFWAVIRACIDRGDGRRELVLIEETRLDAYEDIEALREELLVDPDLVFLDCGNDRNTVLAQCAKFGWTAMHGIATRQNFYHQEPGQDRIRKAWKPPAPEPAYNAGGAMVPVIAWSSQAGQDILDFLIREPGRWTTAHDVSDEYKLQMRSHHKKVSTKKGVAVEEWDRIGKTPDHLWDCETMAAVVMDVLDLVPS